MKYSRNPKLVWRFIDENYYLLKPENSNFSKLNSSASFIWELLEKPKSFDQLKERFIDIFDEPIDKNNIENDIKKFINKMLNDNFIIEIDEIIK